jgi:hypothetical protein
VARALAFCALVLLAAAVAAPLAHAAPPPPNDNFAGAQPLNGSSLTVAGTTVDATRETGERDHAYDSTSRSVWYSWTAPATGAVTIDTVGSQFATVLSAYTGSALNALTLVTEIDAGSDGRSRIRFGAVAGTTYHLAVDVDYDLPGALVLNLELHEGPLNDAFAAATSLVGPEAEGGADATWATKEPGEPRAASGYGGGSVWFAWTAPSDGGVTIDTGGSDFDTTLGVYTGASVNALAHVASNNDAPGGTRSSRVSFRANAGTTYRIMVDGYSTWKLGKVRVALSLRPPPVNDAFGSAIALPSLRNASVAGGNAGAGAELGEPRHFPYDPARNSVWYSWRAPSDGSLTIKATSGFQPVIVAYAGDELTGLKRVTNQAQDWNGGSEQIRIRVDAGVTYRIAIDSISFGGDFVLSLDLVDLPVNDDFEDAIPIVGPLAELVGQTVGATQQPCEPVHDDNYYDPSVWFSWTAPTSGAVTLDTAGSDFPTVLGIYTGDALCSLTRVPVTRHTGPGVPAKRSFRVTASVTYRIAVDGARARSGNYKLALRQYTPPANDMFAEPVALTGELATATGTAAGATVELGEPAATATVWYSWTAPASGRTTVTLPTQPTGTRVSVYSGSTPGALTRLSSDTSYPFTATAGVTYRIAVDGGAAAEAPFELRVHQPPPPKNDNFAAAEPLTGSEASATANTTNATIEPGEPRPGYSYGERSVWYSWTPPADGTATLEVQSSFASVTGVYMGTRLDALGTVASADSWSSATAPVRLKFQVTAGTTYRILVNGDWYEDHGQFKLGLKLRQAPVNDRFADAVALPSAASASATGHNEGATVEYGEPEHQPYYSPRASVWYRWTAPIDGALTIRAQAGFQTALAAYTGSGVSALTRVVNQPQEWNGGPEQIRIRVRAGATYTIAVASQYYAETGDFSLSLSLAPSPANDDFAKAAMLEGSIADVAGSTLGATQEPCEPTHDQNYYDPSVWFEWTAPASGAVRVDTGGSDFPTVLGIYTGDALCTLARVPFARLSAAGEPAKRAWRVKAGVKYRIALDGASARMGNFKLSLRHSGPPPNDLFEDAQDLLTGSLAGVPGTNLGATTQPGESDPGWANGASVWYSWTAATTGLVKVDLPGAGFSYGLTAYTGEKLDALKRVWRSAYGSPLYFRGVAGTKYRFAVDGGSGAEQSDFTVRVQTPPPPPNDDFEDAVELEPESGTREGTTRASSAEIGEPSHYYSSRRASVWYSWTATRDGLASFGASTTDGSETPTVAAYTGEAVSALKLVSAASGTTRFRAVAGQTYRVAVSGPDSLDKGAFRLEHANLPAPANDAFAAAIDVGAGTSWSATGTTVGATRETGEPATGSSNGATVWYSWTAPSTGSAILSLSNGTGSVYTGDSVDALKLVAPARSYPVAFRAVAGRTYRIRMDGSLLWSSGTFQLSLKLTAPPPNDDFVNAVPVSGATASSSGTLVGATAEDGEPTHGDSTYTASAWYSWTAPSTGTAVVTRTANETVHLAAYTGDSVDALTKVAAQGGTIRFRAVAGRTYRIAAWGAQRESNGAFTLGIETLPGPANDNLADATELTGSADTRTSSSENATVEPDEPSHYISPSRSVWYRWRAPSNGRVTFDTAGSSYTTAAAVYSGGPGMKQLKQLASAYGYDTGTRVSAMVRAGETYHFAVDGWNSTSGTVKAKIQHAPAPPNDDFAAAAEMTGPLATATGPNANSTRETGEPSNYGYSCAACGSVWWRWTAPESGIYSLSLSGTDFGATFGVYTGSALNALSKLTSGYFAPGGSSNPGTFRAVAGTTYRFSVDSAGTSGTVRLGVAPVDPPANDHLANAVSVEGQTGQRGGMNATATREAREPDEGASAQASVWYRWTAPTNGWVGFEAIADWGPRMSAYTGSSYDDLQRVTAGNGWAMLYATAGTTYRIRVDGQYGSSRGSFTLRWIQETAPANDLFTDAVTLSGSSARTTGTSSGASREIDEPNHAGRGGARSVWFRWVAPSDGEVTLNTEGSGFDTLLGVYTGPAVGSLQEVVSNDNTGDGITSGVTFDAVAGTEYRIAIDGRGGYAGGYALALDHTPEPEPEPALDDPPAETTSELTAPPQEEPAAPEPPAAGAEDEPAEVEQPATEHEPAADPPAATEPPATKPASNEPPAAAEPPATPEPPVEEPPATEPPVEEPPAQEPPVEEPPFAIEPPSEELSEPMPEAPPADEPPPAEQPPSDQPPAEQPPVEEPPAGEPPVEEPSVEQPPVEEPPAGELPADELAAQEPPAEEPPAQEPPAQEPPAQEPPAEEPPAEEPPFAIEPPSEELSEPIAEAPPADEPTPTEQPASDPPPAEEPPVEEPPAEEPPVDEPPAAEPPAQEPPVEEPAAEETAKQDPPPSEQPPVEEPPLEQPPVQDPPAEDQPAQDQPSGQPPARDPEPAPGDERGAREPEPGAHEPAPEAPPLDDRPGFEPAPAPSLGLTATYAKQRLAAVLAKGLVGTVTCSLACELEVVVRVDAPAARKLGLRGSKLTVIRTTARAQAGRATKVVVQVPKSLRAKLKKARALPLTVEVSARAAGAPQAADTRRVTVNR